MQLKLHANDDFPGHHEMRSSNFCNIFQHLFWTLKGTQSWTTQHRVSGHPMQAKLLLRASSLHAISKCDLQNLSLNIGNSTQMRVLTEGKGLPPKACVREISLLRMDCRPLMMSWTGLRFSCTNTHFHLAVGLFINSNCRTVNLGTGIRNNT